MTGTAAAVLRSMPLAAAGWRPDGAEARELVAAQDNIGGGGVLLEPGDPLGAGDRHDVVPLGEQPGQGYLRGGRSDFGGYRLDLGDDAQVLLEVLLREARDAVAEVAGVELIGRADLPGQEPAAERRPVAPRVTCWWRQSAISRSRWPPGRGMSVLTSQRRQNGRLVASCPPAPRLGSSRIARLLGAADLAPVGPLRRRRPVMLGRVQSEGP
jgi:hypothetical protein